jgi:hypothetical protein
MLGSSHASIRRLFGGLREQLSGAHLVGKSEFLAKLEEYVLLLQPRDATKEDIAAMCKLLQHRKVSWSV